MSHPLPWLEPDTPFPSPDQAWNADAPAPGLLAAGGTLEVERLRQAYANGIFPWFSRGQPILWWSPDPRMVLPVQSFRLHRSFQRVLQKFRANTHCEVRVDHDFAAVIRACATTSRPGQDGTWILPSMVQAYTRFHEAGFAHSVETWINGQLAGGLYFIAVGRAVFGESMFSHASDASKIALAALVCLCRRHGVALIDCQQNTSHLASLGAHEVPRAQFLRSIAQSREASTPDWSFNPVYWNELLPKSSSPG
jgi:leucyl/phenylalanyl-tRNA--protein transferase